MPYELQKSHGKFCVVKVATGSIVPGGCHDSKNEAKKHLDALIINEPASAPHVPGYATLHNNSIGICDPNSGDYCQPVIDEPMTPTNNVVSEAAPASDSGLPEFGWMGPITFENTPTGDGRYFQTDSITWDPEDLPMPFSYQPINAEGHKQSQVIGRVDNIWRHPDNHSIIMGSGVIIPFNSAAWEYMDMMHSNAAGGVSIDGDSPVYSTVTETAADGTENYVRTDFSNLRIRGLTGVAIPAFKDAQISLTASAIGATDLPVASRSEHWDGLSAQKGIFEWASTESGYDTKKLARAFLWRDSNGDPQHKESYKLPFTQVINGTLIAVPKAIFAAAAAIEGARGGVKIPDADKSAIRATLTTLYGKIEGNPTPPFASLDEDSNMDEIYSLVEEVESFATLPPVLIKKLISNLEKSLAKETDPAKKAEIQSKLDKWNKALGSASDLALDEEEDASFAAKTEAGQSFPASDYAYVPDAEKPSTWKLRLTKTPGGTPDSGIVGAAIAALGKGFRGNKVQIPAADLPAVKAKVRAAWKKANPDKKDSDMPETIAASGNSLVAGAPSRPPAGWFEICEPNEPTPLTITEDGQVYGHLALWETCHIGMRECVTPPKNDDFSFFHLGELEADNGERIPVGHVTFNTGHANLTDNAKATARHYDDTGAVGADVVASNGVHGIWVSGALRASIDEDGIRTLRSAPLSGDWRRIGNSLRLIAALSVNVPGFPVPRNQALVAGGMVEAAFFGHDHDEVLVAQSEARKRIKNRIRKSVLLSNNGGN